jgi:hypothetical protein
VQHKRVRVVAHELLRARVVIRGKGSCLGESRSGAQDYNEKGSADHSGIVTDKNSELLE